MFVVSLGQFSYGSSKAPRWGLPGSHRLVREVLTSAQVVQGNWCAWLYVPCHQEYHLLLLALLFVRSHQDHNKLLLREQFATCSEEGCRCGWLQHLLAGGYVADTPTSVAIEGYEGNLLSNGPKTRWPDVGRASISFEDISQPVETLQVVEEQLLIFP